MHFERKINVIKTGRPRAHIKKSMTALAVEVKKMRMKGLQTHQTLTAEEESAGREGGSGGFPWYGL